MNFSLAVDASSAVQRPAVSSNICLGRQQWNVLLVCFSAFGHISRTVRYEESIRLHFTIFFLLAVVPRAVIGRAIDQAQRFGCFIHRTGFSSAAEEINQWQRRQKSEQQISFTCYVQTMNLST